MMKICRVIGIAILGLATWSRAAEPTSALFADPPMQARPSAYWSWLNGNVDLKTLTTDLEEAKAKGMGGLEIWDVGALSNRGLIPAGPAFLSDESVVGLRHALAEGRRLGMRISLIASSGWNAGGAWVTPDWASKHLFVSSQCVTGGVPVEINLPLPEVDKACPMGADGRPQFYRDVAVLAVPQSATKSIARLAEVVDVTEHCKDGKLTWAAPKGEWVLLRFICSNTGQRLIAESPKSGGLFIDFLEPAATERHFGYILERLGITSANAASSGLYALELDSMEMGHGIPWTDRFPEYFQRWCGYDPIRYLPALAGWTIEGATEAFRYDFKKAVSEQLILSHYTTGRDFLKQYGVKLIAESGGPGAPIWGTCPVDALKALGSVSIPRGEFWNRHRNMFLIKEVASAAHIYDLPINEAEAFTTWRRWMDGPFVMKRLADRALCEGLNRFVFHTFAHSPLEAGLPGRAYHAGSDINPRATWWNQSRPFIDYLSRCSYLLQQGHFVADVCAYYGDQCPNFWPLFHDVPRKPLYPGLDAGYDYDVVNTDVILNRMQVQDGRIVLPDGMSYRLLVLPKQEHIPLEVLEKIAELVKAGATVVGPKPTRDARLANQPQRTEGVQQLAESLWGASPETGAQGRAFGKGKVFSGVTPTEVLAALDLPPDFSLLGTANIAYPSLESCSWVWFPEGQPATAAVPGKCYFRKQLSISEDHPVQNALCRITCDNAFKLYVNGQQAGTSDESGESWRTPVTIDITKFLKTGVNQLAIEAVNTSTQPNPAGVLGQFAITLSGEKARRINIDQSWKISNKEHSEWLAPSFNDQSWPAAMVVAQYGQAPWGSFAVVGGENKVDFIHRRTAQTEIYFVRNTGLESGSVTCRFRVKGRQPELWNPVTGQIGIGIAFKEDAEGITVDLPLAPGGSTFVVFPEPGSQKPRFHLTQPVAETSVSGAWSLNFPTDWGAPPEKTVEALQSWTDFTEEGIKYFSGTATYHKTLEITAQQMAASQGVYIDLGDVREVAEVFLNDQPLGIVWQPPYRVALTAAIKPGMNRLEVRVTNLWINRLCGDMLTKGKSYTWTNQRPYANSIGGDETWCIKPSGLLGPVRLLFTEKDGLPAALQAQGGLTELPVTMPVK